MRKGRILIMDALVNLIYVMIVITVKVVWGIISLIWTLIRSGFELSQNNVIEMPEIDRPTKEDPKS